jgi:hypothetical protein
MAPQDDLVGWLVSAPARETPVIDLMQDAF